MTFFDYGLDFDWPIGLDEILQMDLEWNALTVAVHLPMPPKQMRKFFFSLIPIE